MPQRPCQTLCTAFFSSCSSQIAQYAALLTGIVPANCTVVDDAGTPLFPDGAYTDAGVDLNCTAGASGAVQAECPKPLKPVRITALQGPTQAYHIAHTHTHRS